MSISATLSNALSGLTAASRGAQIVSTNVANAATEGYARRVIDLSPRMTAGIGAGVQVDGVRRVIDETVLRERRLAEASFAEAGAIAEFYSDAADLLGQPDQPNSLTGVFSAFETSLSEAISRPDSEARLGAVLNSANALVGKLDSVSDGIQKLREDADAQIELDIKRLNAKLSQIADLNGDILRAKGANQDYPSLLDQRQRLIDEISELIPIRQLPRENDTVALYSQGGALLVDVTAAEFSFTSSAPITPDMTIGSGALSGLTLNSRELPTAGALSPISGGKLSALFRIRDDLSISAQASADEIARDLISRFEDPILDASLSAGDPGLFTDRASPLDVANVVGLAGRISVNPAIDTSLGGELWRIRDGLYAPSPGAVGDSTLLLAMKDRLTDTRAPLDPILGTSQKDSAGFASGFLSRLSIEMEASRSSLAYEAARYEGLRSTELSGGVDTDEQMQQLLMIEQAYAANARVIQTADELLDLLIGL